MKAVVPNDQLPPAGGHDADSSLIISTAPNDKAYYDRQNQAFERVFYDTLNGDTLGGITSYLFHDLNRHPRVYASGYDPIKILSGGRAWERTAAENAEKPDDSNNFGTADKRAIRFALAQGLANLIPNQSKLISYCGGDPDTFMWKEGQIIGAVISTPGKNITDGVCAVDIFPRYIQGITILVSQYFDLPAEGVSGNVLTNGRLAIKPSSGTPVIMIFGGTFENVPETKSQPDALTNAAIAWGKINRQHGLGSIVIKTFDGDQSAENQNRNYAPTENFEAFELSAFARAASLGIIKNPQYDVLKHWKLASEYNPDQQRQEMRAECKLAHTLHTPKGDYPFELGDKRMIFTLSHKWDLATHANVIHRAGGDILRVFHEPGNPKQLVVVKFNRDPDPDISQLIPY